MRVDLTTSTMNIDVSGGDQQGAPNGGVDPETVRCAVDEVRSGKFPRKEVLSARNFLLEVLEFARNDPDAQELVNQVRLFNSILDATEHD